MRFDARRRARRGSVLVTYAMLFFALLGVAALVIDLGSARLTQSQMQSAVDTAALEGLRNSNGADDRGRETASWFVALAFDDDLDPDPAKPDPMQFGAGPVYSLTGGIGGDPYASQKLDVSDNPNARAYKPRRADGKFGLEPNAANAPHGDIVAGQFDPTAPPGETSSYSRDDFDPTATTKDALLVRMRRANSNHVSGLGDPQGVFTNEQPLPFLFGRGSMIRADPTSNYNPRRDGITVRATAVAQAVPVKTAGPVSADGTVRGVTPFALRRESWATLGTTATTLTVGADGSVATTGGAIIGRVIDPTKGITIAQRVDDRLAVPPAALPVTFTTDPTRFVVVPLYDDNIDMAGARWIVGFGLVKITEPSPTNFVLQRLTGGTRITGETEPLRNVSGAVLQKAGNAIPNDIAPAALDEVFKRNRELAPGTAPDTVGPYIALAPVLVR